MSQPLITIQDVGESTLKVNVNGQMQEIQNQLSELKTLLGNLEVQQIQYADKIYNIEHINEANFGFVTGKKAFNEELTKVLIEAIARDAIPAGKFLDRVQSIPHWEQQSRISDKAKEIIAYSFVGVIGIQLSKLMAIGKEVYSEEKQLKYIRKCITIVKRTLDLLNFTMLSRLWDIQKQQPLQFSDTAKKAFSQFFDRSFEQSLEEQFELLTQLHLCFAKQAASLPFPDFDFDSHKESLREVCKEVQSLNQLLDKGEYSLLECSKAETQLTAFFRPLYFLVNYNMASIKRIGYKQMRHVAPRYLHSFARLGLDSKANKDAEDVAYTSDTVHTDAVLIYKGDDYQKNINLFPLVIDMNALTFEHGAKICFYQGKNISDGSLEYRFLEDGESIYVEPKGLIQNDTDYQKLMKSIESQKDLNLDQVIVAFEAARQAFLPDEVYLDDL